MNLTDVKCDRCKVGVLFIQANSAPEPWSDKIWVTKCDAILCGWCGCLFYGTSQFSTEICMNCHSRVETNKHFRILEHIES